METIDCPDCDGLGEIEYELFDCLTRCDTCGGSGVLERGQLCINS